jgi:hypothetical protein
VRTPPGSEGVHRHGGNATIQPRGVPLGGTIPLFTLQDTARYALIYSDQFDAPGTIKQLHKIVQTKGSFRTSITP